MNIKHLLNPGLKTEIQSSGVVEIYDMTMDNLKEIGFIDATGWPTGKMKQLMEDIEKISPSDFLHDVQYWDLLSKGFSVYNNFIEDGANEEEE